MEHNFRSLEDIFNKDEDFNKLRNLVKSFDVAADFYTIFPELQSFVSAATVNNKMLLIRVENSVMRHELFLKNEMMIKKINDYYNEPRIKAIRFSG
ncbi:MAG: DciA family protein [Bacteroidota bacterium]|nr:DciA family protein [Bacteroidota bacterium]